METNFILGIIAAVFASSGFWAVILHLVQRRDKRKTAFDRLLLGLGHEKIVNTGLKYIEQGEITKVQYQDLIKYLWEPYKALGGNGTAEKIIEEVKKLPIKKEVNE